MHRKPITCGILLVNYTNDKVEWLAAGVSQIPSNVGLVNDQIYRLRICKMRPANGKQGPAAFTSRSKIILIKYMPIA